MPATTAPPKIKISVNLTGETAERVERLAEQKGLTVSEIVRRALAMELFVEDELAKGSDFLLRSEAGELERVAFIFG